MLTRNVCFAPNAGTHTCARARNDVTMRRPTSIPGEGVLNATTLVAAVGDASSFAKPRCGRLAPPKTQTVKHRRQTSPAWDIKTATILQTHADDHKRFQAACSQVDETITSLQERQVSSAIKRIRNPSLQQLSRIRNVRGVSLALSFLSEHAKKL